MPAGSGAGEILPTSGALKSGAVLRTGEHRCRRTDHSPTPTHSLSGLLSLFLISVLSLLSVVSLLPERLSPMVYSSCVSGFLLIKPESVNNLKAPFGSPASRVVSPNALTGRSGVSGLRLGSDGGQPSQPLQRACVSANDLRNRWHTLGGEDVTPAEGGHFPSRNGSYGSDVLLLDETEVNALNEAGHRELPRLASSGSGMTALYDMGENPAGRYLIASRGQIFYCTDSFQEVGREYIHRAAQVRREEVQKFLAAFDSAIEAGLDHYQASDVARGFITLEKVLNPQREENQVTDSGDDAGLNEIPF